jgi:hypothetical protein
MKLTEIFLSFVISSFIACILALAQYLFKSKCDEVKCCFNLVSFHRRVELESQTEEQIIELPKPLQKRASSLDSILKK